MKDTKYMEPAEFAKRGEGVVHFGRAPDGIPWVTEVAPAPSGAILLERARHVFRLRDAKPDFEGTPLHGIAQALDELIRNQYSQRIEIPGGESVRATILPRPLHGLIGNTLLERLFSLTARTYIRPQTSPFSGDREATRSRAEGATHVIGRDNPGVFSFQQGDACIAFPEDNRAVTVVYMTHNPAGWPSFAYRRPFMEETLTALTDATFCFQRSGNTLHEVPCGDYEEYVKQRRASSSGEWVASVRRLSLGRKLQELALAVDAMQTAGQVHGDIKPGNVLVSAEGLKLIDGLQLDPGMPSPALTPGWAAPEQVMADGVTATTDQFPVGLMLLAMVNGVLFGEETNIVVPSGGTATTRHTICLLYTSDAADEL